jgi:hypothetical protein
MMVKTIEPNGVVTDGYFFVTEGQLSPAQITANGSQVKVITRVNAVAELSRLGDDRLTGSLTSPTGITFPITLTKVSTHASLANRNRDFDPQSLVGEWVGSWAPGSGGSYGAAPRQVPYILTIRGVAEPKVFMHLEVIGIRHFETDLVGILAGNRLTYGRTQLTIYDLGNLMEMRGTAEPPDESSVPRQITLHKKK